MTAPAVRIESLMSARLFLSPQRVGKRIFFISNLSGHMSLYAMNWGGSVPEPLIPPHIALQNPELIGGHSFAVLPKIGKIVVMIDKNGDENYQPTLIPMEGGVPEPAFTEVFSSQRMHMGHFDTETSVVCFSSDSLTTEDHNGYLADFAGNKVVKLASSRYGAHPLANDDHTKAVIFSGYTAGDDVMHLWEAGKEGLRLIAGMPLENRKEGETYPLPNFGSVNFVKGNKALLLTTALFQDTGSPAYIKLTRKPKVEQVAVEGIQHAGAGELAGIENLRRDQYAVYYNIDGASWVYEARFVKKELKLVLERVLVGTGTLANGTLQHIHYEKESNGYALSFSTATSPSQIYTIDGRNRDKVVRHTNERILGIPHEWMSPGEDASYTSHDGMRVSARLYLPASALGYKGNRPVVLYVHGGPQGQEKPDFTWFSMPLIQFLTMSGFAVFVPNARGSTGYGLDYMKRVDRDWGGQDRLDHVHAMTQVLPKDARLDVSRAGVVGRSYGGYMTLTLAFRHPELWKGAVDMFGPYDLMTFSERIPAGWKPYYELAVGDPKKDQELLVRMSPKTYEDNLACPMLVIQGRNDPRVVAQESLDVVERLKAKGKSVDMLLFEDEGHDVLKFNNRVKCYNAIRDFFAGTLKP